MRYHLFFHPAAMKELKRMPETYQGKFRQVFGTLEENPFSYPYKKIRGETQIYRIRVGKYRLLYEVDESDMKIFILKLDTRAHGYK